MRKLLSATLVLMLSASSQALAQHPPVTLVDISGKPILAANGTVQSNLPVSYERSCSACHNLDFINMGWHMQQGRLSTLSPDIYSQVYSKYGSSNNLPQDQSGLYLKWFGPKNIYGPGGMYNRISVPHMLKMAPYQTNDPLDVDFTTAEWNEDCAICHTGGGLALHDQKGNKLSDENVAQVQTDLNNGIYDTDYLEQNDTSGKLEVYNYKEHGVRDNDCLLCHATNGYDWGMSRIAAMGMHKPGIANTLAAEIGTLNLKTGTYQYNATKVQQLYTKIGPTTNESCARCHAGVYDEGNMNPANPDYLGLAGTTDGRITPWDNLDVFPPFGKMLTGITHDMSYIHQAMAFFTSPGFFKRGMVIGNTVEPGSDGQLHKVYDPNKTVDYFDPNTQSWKPVPYVGVHLQNGMKCSQCHKQVTSNTLQYAQPSWMPSHDFGKGTDGFNVRSDLSGTTTCIMCHGDYMDVHKGLFPSNSESVHMKYIHCTTCHIPQKFKGVVHTLVEDKVSLNPGSWTPQFANFKVINGTPEVVPFTPDYVWFPHIKSKGAAPQLMVKPANAIAVLTWRLSDGRPVPSRFLSMVFADSKGNITGKIHNPLTNENMTLSGDTNFEKEMHNMMGTPYLVTSAKEIKFAAQAIEDAIKKVYPEYVEQHSDLKVQYVYHLGILDGSYIMSHNIAPVSSKPMQTGGDAAYANDATHVLQCQDCHNAKGKFNRPVQKYPHIDTVPGVTVFEVPKAAIEGYNGTFTEADLRRLTYAYFSPTDVQISLPEDGNATLVAVSTSNGTPVEPSGTVPPVDTSFVPSGYTVEQAVVLKLTGNTTFEITVQGNTADYKVFTSPSSALVNATPEPNGKIKVTLTPPRGSDVTVAAAKASTTTAPSGNATATTENATTSGGGGGGGCSLTPSAGFGGILSMIAGLLPFGILRRKKEEE